MGYLRRNPDDGPDFNTLNGFHFWLDKLNLQTFAGGDPHFARQEMIRAFITSPEYTKRFYDDPHCGQPAAAEEEPPPDEPWGDPCGGGMIC